MLALDPTLSTLLYAAGWAATLTSTQPGWRVDEQSKVYVAGTSDEASNYPTTAAALQTSRSGRYDGLLSVLDPTLSALLYSTYLGGSESDSISYIAVGSGGKVYVAGDTSSTNFPAFPSGGYDTTHNGSNDAFVSVLDPTLRRQLYGTFLGGSGADGGDHLAFDAAGNVYVTGKTKSTDFPIPGGTAARRASTTFLSAPLTRP